MFRQRIVMGLLLQPGTPHDYRHCQERLTFHRDKTGFTGGQAVANNSPTTSAPEAQLFFTPASFRRPRHFVSNPAVLLMLGATIASSDGLGKHHNRVKTTATPPDYGF